jgi:uncharacterized delta-60 repeat protein
MASYIELDKQSSFPPSSNVGKVIFGVDSNGNITLTNSSGETIPIGSLPYLEYVSKISRIGVNSPKTSYLLNNTLNINPIWERVSSGNFRFKFDNEIDIDKTISNVPLINTPFSYGITNELNPSNNFKLGFNNSVISIAIQSNEKILVGGEFTTYNGTNSNYIIRLNSDGSVDNTFLSIDDGFDDRVFSISIQSDGKILVGGGFASYNGTNSNSIIRLNSDGSVDNTFLSIDNGFDDVVNSIVIQSDGKILVGGDFSTYNGTNSNSIIRLNSDGSVDNTFLSIDDGFNSQVRSIAIQSDGKILVGGNFTTYNGTGSNYIIRLNSDGSVDNTFLSIDDGFDSRVFSISIQSDGKILIGGQFTTYNGTNSNYIIRLNSDGSVDNTFLSIDNGFDDVVSSIAIQSDGKILVGGYFTTYNGTNSNYIIRLNSNGSSGFIGGFDDIVTSIAIQSNGKILVGGKFSTYNGTNSNYIIRLNSDGSVDNTFLSIDNGFDSTVNSIAIQDGKILVGGGFNSYNGTNSNCIIRLNSDGSVDNTFLSIDDGFDSQVNTIAIQSDGKILVGGGFTSYNGTNSNYIIRLNSDGSVDNTFLSIDNGFDDYVNYITIQSNGKILVGGNFTTYNGTGSNRIIRLNSDGSVDNTFLSIDNGFDDSTIAIQSDGNVLVGGSFNSIDNVNYLAKFDNEFFYNLTGDDNFVNQPIEIKVYN